MPTPKNPTRRQFLKTTTALAGGITLSNSLSRAAAPANAPIPNGAPGFAIWIYHDPANAISASAPVQWAIGHLRDLLKSRGVNVVLKTDKPGTGDFGIVVLPNVGFDPKSQDKPEFLKYAPEAMALMPSRDIDTDQGIMVSGGSPLGLVYALTELADRVRLSPDPRTALQLPAPLTESPANKIRSLFRMFASDTEDKRWFYDRDQWHKYLDMLVANRFNRFNLSFGLSYDFSRGLTDTYTFFMYPFFVNAPGYNVRAVAKNGTPVPQEEQAKNLDTLKFISDQCAARGLNFNLGIWTHNYIWQNSPNATYTIDGLNAQTQAPYSRDAMRIILAACPGITGVTLRTHGESGVPEGSYELWKIIFAGINGLKNPDGTRRVIELDLHAKTMTQEMIDTALATDQPVTLSAKFWAEHMGLPYVQSSIREAEMPKGRDATGLMALSSGTRSFLRYGIGDLLTKNRKYKIIHRVWPGTQRLLLWGDPLYAAEYGRAAHFAGIDGIEYFEPLSFKGRAGSSMNIPAAPDRTGYADASLRPTAAEGGEWAKYAYTFRLWGRLAYNPDAAPDTWQRQLTSDFGPAAADLETALANASRVLPLITTAHCPAAANAVYWPEMLCNMSIYDPARSGPSSTEAPAPKVFGNVSSLDPQMFATVNDYVGSLLSNKPLAKISPLDVARQLDTWATTAAKILQNHDPLMLPARRTNPHLPDFKRLIADATIQAGLGQFFAHKFRAAICWQLFNLSGHEPARVAAMDAYKKARAAWAALTDTAHVYLPDLTFGPDRQLRHHWSERLPDIDTDITGMATRTPQLSGTTYQSTTIDQLIQAVLNPIRTADDALARDHKPPATFTPNQPLTLEIRAAFDSVRLCYRHLHQGERYTTLDMPKQNGTFTATIPAAYTNSPFPLQYYFELRTPQSATMHPGFKENFTGTPYFLIQQT